jgi:uncharacterized membrane protein
MSNSNTLAFALLFLMLIYIHNISYLLIIIFVVLRFLYFIIIVKVVKGLHDLKKKANYIHMWVSFTLVNSTYAISAYHH